MKSTEAKVGAFVVICAAILCATVYSVGSVRFRGARTVPDVLAVRQQRQHQRHPRGDHHRWADDPGATIAAAMIDALRSAQLFSAVVPYDGQEKQECVLSGRLARLDEVDYGGRVRAGTRLVAELVNRRTGETLCTGEASETSTIETRTVASVVGAMSHAVETSIDRLIASMDQQVLRF